MDNSPYKVCVAPMMDWTDRHCRYFLRLISKHALLYTEMVTADALLHGSPERFLAHHTAENPLALQLGGSDPQKLALAARIGYEFDYDEINLNVGCPSDRVQSGRFGACLMAEPELVADCVQAMREAVPLPVTVKTRIGIDDMDNYEDLRSFVEIVIGAGCRRFIIHARKAILKGLSPKQNREIPPLNYAMAARIKADFENIDVVLNGGIKSLPEIAEHLQLFDGVMIGREAYSNPYFLSAVDAKFFDANSKVRTRTEIVVHYKEYVAEQLQAGIPLNRMLRHVLGLFQGCPGARNWRRHLSENASRLEQNESLLTKAMELVNAA